MRKLESGIIFEGYEFVAGRDYIHAISSEFGKRNKRRRLTDEGKRLIREIAEITDYGTMSRHRKMGIIWHDEDLSREV